MPEDRLSVPLYQQPLLNKKNIVLHICGRIKAIYYHMDRLVEQENEGNLHNICIYLSPIPRCH